MIRAVLAPPSDWAALTLITPPYNLLLPPFYRHNDEAYEAVCCVCGLAHSLEGNKIVFCDRCNMAVHMRCYGMAHVPDGECGSSLGMIAAAGTRRVVTIAEGTGCWYA